MITDRQLDPWANLLKVHLKEFRPKQYQSLLQAGKLNDHVQEVSDRAEEELNDLLNQGMLYHQAMERIQEQLYPSPEPPTPLRRQQATTT